MFSRSLYHLKQRRARALVFAMLVVLGTAYVVRYALSRVPARESPTGDEGIHEVAE